LRVVAVLSQKQSRDAATIGFMNGIQRGKSHIVCLTTVEDSTAYVLQGLNLGLTGSGVNGSTLWIYAHEGVMVEVLGKSPWILHSNMRMYEQNSSFRYGMNKHCWSGYFINYTDLV
jgi:hypothetical protein